MAGMTTRVGWGVVLGDSDSYIPFYHDKHDDIEDWWRHLQGYKPLPECWSKSGERNDGITQSDIDEYFNHRKEFDKQNPCPVDIERHFSWDYPTYILYLKDTIVSEYDEPLILPSCVATGKQVVEFQDLLDYHGIEYNGQPTWIISSCYNN